MNTLNIGDKVMWRGGFGREAPKEATIEGIDIVAVGEKYGEAVDSIDWSLVRQNRAVVTLDNGHWAYGDQIEQIS